MSLFVHIKSLLGQNQSFAKGNELFKNKVVEAALRLDPGLLSLLLRDERAKSTFFQEVEGIYVFDKLKFQKFISNKEFLPDSFTAFKNKIGLTAQGKFLSESKEVVLDFPYKDCILEGGQTKEDQKRKEVFWNEILASDQIDRLFEPKVLTNWKRISAKGVSEVNRISETDNLIIKGNNLIVLHSLKHRFRNKINLIYIDPPYNTGSDSFGYNDQFNQSSWLTFMKNRLEVAKDLLALDGVILVQCSFHQFAYLKILMLDIFPKHLCDFNIQVRHPDRSLTGDKEYNDVIEYILIFTRNKNGKMPYREEAKTLDDYVLQIEIAPNEKPHKVLNFDGKKVEVYLPGQYAILTASPDDRNFKKISIRGSLREKNSSGRFYVKHLENLKEFPSETLFKVPDIGDDGHGFRYFYSAPHGKKNGGYFQGMPQSSSVTKKQYANFYNFEKEYNNVARQGGVSFRNGKKPEELLKFLIEIFTKEGDWVLDYHLGSGTTCAVAHKLGRKYIGIEQMDYIEELAVQRLKNVIAGEREGISKEIDWQGGGDFLYCELMPWSARYLARIADAEDEEELLEVYHSILENHDFLYTVDEEKMRESVREFSELSILEQKKLLISLLDKNNLYVNYQDRMSDEFDLGENDLNLNDQFYGKI